MQLLAIKKELLANFCELRAGKGLFFGIVDFGETDDLVLWLPYQMLKTCDTLMLLCVFSATDSSTGCRRGE